MNIDSEENDDFFGEQLDEDSNVSPSGVDEIETEKARRGLNEHENRAGEENYRNVGYLDAFEQSKEVRLQDGFEAGYREVIKDSSDLGYKFGRIAIKSYLSPVRDSKLHDSSHQVKQLLTTYDKELHSKSIKNGTDSIKMALERLKKISESS